MFSRCSVTMHKSCICVNFIAEHTRAKEEATKVHRFLVDIAIQRIIAKTSDFFKVLINS